MVLSRVLIYKVLKKVSNVMQHKTMSKDNKEIIDRLLDKMSGHNEKVKDNARGCSTWILWTIIYIIALIIFGLNS